MAADPRLTNPVEEGDVRGLQAPVDEPVRAHERHPGGDSEHEYLLLP
jgi:hypothetical protein